jgi:GT2 family glycosyltransferase
MARYLMRSECDWLIMIDTDIEFTPDQVQALLDDADPDDRPIVSGVVQVLGDDLQPYPALYTIDMGKPAVPVTPEPDTVQRVDGCGCGFLLIHRKVLEALGNFPFSQMITALCEYSEDLSFCLKATIGGFPVHVDTSIKVGHYKTILLR